MAAPFLPIDTSALMFNTMVHPHLDYCCTIWGTTSYTNIGMRIILQFHPGTRITDMVMFLTAVLVLKIMHSKTPNYMFYWLVTVLHQYGTRRSTS